MMSRYEALGVEVFATDGCTRLNSGSLQGADPCKKRTTVVILMIVAISMAMIGDIYSEKQVIPPSHKR